MNRNIKIAFIVDLNNQFYGSNPTFRHIFSLCKAMKILGFDCYTIGYYDMIFFNIDKEYHDFTYGAFLTFLRKFVHFRLVNPFINLIELKKFSLWFKKKYIDVVFLSWPLINVIQAAKRSNCKVIYWDVDVPDVIKPKSKIFMKLASDCDLILTYGKNNKKLWREAGSIKVEEFLHFYDPIYFYKKFTTKNLPISFIGNYSLVKLGKFIKYLFPLAKTFPYKVHIFGNDLWKKSPIYKYIIYHGQITWYLMNDVFNSTKINLNFSSQLQSDYGCLNPRIFEVLGSGNFLITDKVNCIENYFENKKEIALMEESNALVDLVSYYLFNNEEREKIAEKGYQKVSKYHTVCNRAIYLAKLIYNIL
jgi:spore maturation protein CgeB